MTREKQNLPKIVLPEDVQKPEQLISKIHSAEGHMADLITNFSGSMWFVYLHGIWFAFWILANAGLLRPFIYPFDHFPYGLLTMIVSLEAIFLSTFILISQNRQALVDTYREIEEEQEQKEEEKEQEELGQDVEQLEKGVGELGVEFDDMQQDLDDIKNALNLIQAKLSIVEEKRSSAAAKTK